MALRGKRKAAMLLMGLDVTTVKALLKGLSPAVVEELAMELARIDASGLRDSREREQVVQEFYNCLESQEFSIRSFFGQMLESLVGREKAEEIQAQVRIVTQKKDPFIEIRSASTDELVLALDGEGPQTIGTVLSELDPEKSQEILPLLDEDIRNKAVYRIANMELVGSDVKRRIAMKVSERLKLFKGETLPERREQNLRKLSLMLGGLETELRDRLLEEIGKQDEETGRLVRNLMMTWEDIPLVADRSLQEALRSVEAAKLAVALYGADAVLMEKVRSNISERAAEMLDEERSLMQEPLEKEIREAREEVIKPLRQANEDGTLRFVRR